MNSKRWILFFLIGFGFASKAAAMNMGDVLVLADFNNKKLMTNLGGALGTWKKDPNDNSTGCEISFDGSQVVGDQGYCLRVDYNIDSHMTTYVTREDKFDSPEIGYHDRSYNGVYMLFKGFDVSAYKYLALSVRGDETAGYTRKFKLDVKDKERTANYMIDGITSHWKRYFIPLWDLKSTINLKDIQEIVVVFDQNVTFPKGTIYLDEFYLANSKIDIEDYYSYKRSFEESLKPAREEEKVEPIPHVEPIVEAPEPEPAPEPAKVSVDQEKQEIVQTAKANHFEVKQEEDHVLVTTHILFDIAKHQILSSEIPKLKTISELMKSHPSFYVEIHGHTDSIGGKAYNLTLSRKRAEATREYLVHSENIETKRLSSYGWGLSKPVASNQTREGRAENRRVEFVFKQEPTAPLYPRRSPITIDGDLQDWDPMETFKLSKDHVELGEAQESEVSASIRFTYDDQFLYFAARVWDPEIVCLHFGKDIYKTDCVELYINPDGDGLVWGDPKDIQIGFTPKSPSGEPQVWAWFQNRKPRSDEVRFASKILSDGYTIEAALSWKMISEELATKMSHYRLEEWEKPLPLKISVAVHDRNIQKRPYETKLNWNFHREEDSKKIRLGTLQIFQR